MKNYFKDKVVIVTGASSGIGRSCVYQLAQKGAKLVLVSRNQERMEQIKKDLDKIDIQIVVADVSNNEQVEHMVQAVIDRHKTIDILINNAGIGMHGSIVTTPLSTFQKVVDVNLFGVLYCIRAVYPHMKEKSQGFIVNVSSVAGFKGFYDSGLYSATKFAVSGLTESLSMEAENDNIKVMLVCPGMTNTEFEKNLIYNDVKSHTKRTGVSADFVAEKIISGIVKGKKLIVVGKGCKTLYILNRISPNLTNFLIKKVY
jgi:short-subunit dehydrogenase